MSTDERPEDSVRREAAAEERVAIIRIVERYMRLVSHGHGADGAQVLQHLLNELEERDRLARHPTLDT